MSVELQLQPRPPAPAPAVALEPRPPVPGSESPPDAFQELQRLPGHFQACPDEHLQGHIDKHFVEKSQAAPLRATMAPSPKATSESGSLRGFEPEGSADVTPPFSESSNSAHSSPAYLRWAENLHNLLSDPDGVELYKNYLKTENVGELLDFWFACEGLKRLPGDQNEKIYQLIKVINRKFLRSKMVPIQEETRKSIQEKVASKLGTDQTIFDTAQQEVEERMTRTTYRNFLASEMYLAYIQAQQVGPGSDFSPKHSDSHSTESSLSGRGGVGGLPLADDSGHFSGPATGDAGERSKSGASTRPPTSLAPEGSTSGSTSGVSESSMPAPLPSSSSSSLQPSLGAIPGPNNTLNLSSNQPSRDVTREGDSLVEEIAPGGAGPPLVQSLQSQSHSALPTLHEDSELDCQVDASSTLPSLPSSLITSLTAQPLSMNKRRQQVKPEAQAGLYLMQGGRVPPNPYHAYNSTYNPVSRQDSELQSVSSHNDTTDDNQSSFTESSSHYSNTYRSITNKKYMRKQAKRMQEQTRHNRESSSGGGHGSSHHPGSTAFIPRTARVPTEAANQLPPAEFAAVLTQKLEKLKREQEINDRLSRKLSEECGSMVSQSSSKSLADILREKLILPDDGDGDQSILDDHVSRVWTDKTPLRSPGDPTAGTRARGGSRGGPGQQQGARGSSATRVPPSMGSSRQGGPRGRLPPSGPSSRHQGQLYHQDLAYYDVDSRGGRGTIPLGLEGGQTNDRVMEWMLGVERSGGGEDQRSLSSRGATREAASQPTQHLRDLRDSRTSPRSKHRQAQHRSMSQERAAMSTSWSGHPAMSALNFQGQLDAEAKRRLGSSMQMPPPSGSMQMPPPSQSASSTLRKSAAQARPQAVPGEITVAVYTFSHEKGEPMPYRVKIPTKSVSLRHVKDFLPKKGAFRFYFKTEVDGDMCYEEETEDSSLVPLWEGKVLVQCRLLE